MLHFVYFKFILVWLMNDFNFHCFCRIVDLLNLLQPHAVHFSCTTSSSFHFQYLFTKFLLYFLGFCVYVCVFLCFFVNFLLILFDNLFKMLSKHVNWQNVFLFLQFFYFSKILFSFRFHFKNKSFVLDFLKIIWRIFMQKVSDI